MVPTLPLSRSRLAAISAIDRPVVLCSSTVIALLVVTRLGVSLLRVLSLLRVALLFGLTGLLVSATNPLAVLPLIAGGRPLDPILFATSHEISSLGEVLTSCLACSQNVAYSAEILQFAGCRRQRSVNFSITGADMKIAPKPSVAS